jgi:NADH:ubiquinone oxidoreductase subunit H
MLNTLENIIKVFTLIIPLLVAVAYFTLAERKVLGSMQIREGPNTVGIKGIIQPIADGIKLFSKERIIPTKANKVIYKLAATLALMLALII